MKTKTILVAAIVIVVLGGYAFASPDSVWNGMMNAYGFGTGMMNSIGYGMMGNPGWNGQGMMGGSGYGFGNHCGGTGPAYGDDKSPITIDDAKKSVDQYLTDTGNDDLELAELLQFSNHFYAGVKEKSTGKYAFELIINKYTGAVFPEMGPNMMWNTKYGHINTVNNEASVSEKQVLKNAQDYLDSALPGSKVNDADSFYGYYTMEVTQDGRITGMLSVNSNTGAVWYHGWHGTFEKELEEE